KPADVCLQCNGGYGYMDEYLISRMYRDARVGTIVGGTSEIMREIIARIMIDQVGYQPVSE
ncbi:MAG: acyl-CoA dehydrogenase, partial [Syntrophales bacterium LBB04]|nr:acyl-CoA dehydrogenase [Syntrophales bacterium LBB04]